MIQNFILNKIPRLYNLVRVEKEKRIQKLVLNNYPYERWKILIEVPLELAITSHHVCTCNVIRRYDNYSNLKNSSIHSPRPGFEFDSVAKCLFESVDVAKIHFCFISYSHLLDSTLPNNEFLPNTFRIKQPRISDTVNLYEHELLTRANDVMSRDAKYFTD